MEGPVSGRRISRRMRRTIIIAVCLLLLVIAAIIGANIFADKLAEKREQERQAEIKAASKELSSAVARPLQQAVARIRQTADSPELAKLFREGDATALANQAANLVKDIPAAINVRLFLPGDYELDRESHPPLGYASLDLLNKAGTSSTPLPAEIHNFGSDSSHVVVVARTEDKEGNLLGLLHVSLKPDGFIQPESFNVENGYVELLQKTGGALLVLNRSGDERFKRGNPVSQQIADSRWQIRYWPETSTVAMPTASGGGLPIIPVVLVLLLLLLAGLFFYMRKGKASADTGADAANGTTFGGAIKAIQDGLHPGLEKLIPNLPGMGQKKGVKPVSQGMGGEDVTRVADADTRSAEEAAAEAGKVAGTAEVVEEESPTPPSPAAKPEETGAPPEKIELSPVIFRAYDIRGKVDKELTPDVVREIGRAIGSEALARSQSGIVVGRDGRNSSEELSGALIEGLRSTGADVIDIGMMPTPVLYYATHYLETDSGVMVTGSHNGPEYNGLKIVLDGETLSGEAIQAIRQRIENEDLASGKGGLRTAEIMSEYIRAVSEDIPVALGQSLKVVVDCGNGAASTIAPQLYRAIGHDVIELYCEVDGNFPNHHPDPSQPDNLQDLINTVKENEADLGLAFDGDGDRLGVVDGQGNIIWPDRQMMLFARDVLSRNAGKPVIFDVKCSRYLKAIIEMSNGEPVMWKTGHSLIKNKMREIDAPLAGEMSGHIFFRERWYGFDDALYAGARLLEILTASKEKPDAVFADLPGGIATPELRVPLPEKYHVKFMQALKKKARFEDAEVTDIDGLRVDFSDRWGLIRPSNTTPCLVVRFEAENEASLDRIKTEFRELIQSVTKDLKLPF